MKLCDPERCWQRHRGLVTRGQGEGRGGQRGQAGGWHPQGRRGQAGGWLPVLLRGRAGPGVPSGAGGNQEPGQALANPTGAQHSPDSPLGFVAVRPWLLPAGEHRLRHHAPPGLGSQGHCGPQHCRYTACPTEASAYPGGEQVPGGPWTATGSAWGDTKMTLRQGAGYGTGRPETGLSRLRHGHEPRRTPSQLRHSGAPRGQQWEAGLGGEVVSKSPLGCHPVPTPMAVPSTTAGGCGTQTPANGHAPDLVQAVPCPLLPHSGRIHPFECHRCPWGAPAPGQGWAGRGARSTGAGWARASLRLAGVPLLNLGWNSLLCFLFSWYRPLPASQALDQSLAPALPKHIFPVPAQEPAEGRGARGSGGRRHPARPPAPLEARPRRRMRRCGTACWRQGSPSPASPRYLASCGVRRGRGRGRWRDPLPPGLGVQK